jgi:N-acetylglutamate synthase-like GNAT family acetyltransferase
VDIRPLDASEHAAGCDAVIQSLPYLFGDPSGRAECAAAVRSQRGLVAVDGDGLVLGFLTIKQHFNESGEITRMAVQASHRRHGIGRALINAIGADLSKAGLAELFVLTLGPSVAEPDSEDNYEGTRRFYQSAGFVPLRELSLRTWSDDYALILARHLRSD